MALWHSMGRGEGAVGDQNSINYFFGTCEGDIIEEEQCLAVAAAAVCLLRGVVSLHHHQGGQHADSTATKGGHDGIHRCQLPREAHAADEIAVRGACGGSSSWLFKRDCVKNPLCHTVALVMMRPFDESSFSDKPSLI
jgi:hypothetical protein